MSKRSLAIAYSMKNKKKKASGGTVESGDSTMNYAKGGRVRDEEGVHTEIAKGKSMAGELVRGKRSDIAKGIHKLKLDDLRKMPKPTMKAHGGEVSEGDPAWVCSSCGSHGLTFTGHQDGSHQMDMVSGALKKRKMNHGGYCEAPEQVGGSAKYSHGGQVANETQDCTADEMPNEFDDLVLRDDEEIGTPHKEDLVAKAMKKRKAK